MKNDGETIREVAFVAEKLTRGELAKGHLENELTELARRDAVEKLQLFETVRETVEREGRGHNAVADLKHQRVVRNHVLHLHLVEEDHVRTAQIGRTGGDALPA